MSFPVDLTAEETSIRPFDPQRYGLRSEETSAQAAAWSIVELVCGQPEWLHRCVEQVRFDSAGEVTRRTTLDLTVESTSWQGIRVPLRLVPKARMRNLEVREGGTRTVPILTRRETASLSATALRQAIALARPELGSSSVPLPARLRALVDEIAHGEPEEALSARERLLSSDPRIAESELFGELSRRLSEAVALIAVVDGDVTRRLLTVDYEMTEIIPASPRWIRPIRRVADGGDTVWVDLSGLPDAEELLFELSSPPHSVLSHVGLVGGRAVTTAFVQSDRRQVSLRRERTAGERPLIGFASVRPSPRVTGAALGGAAIVLALVLLITLDSVSSSVSEWSAVLLIVPSLVAMFFGRPLARDIGGVGLAGIRAVLRSMLFVAVTGVIVMIQGGYNVVADGVLVLASLTLAWSSAVLAVAALRAGAVRRWMPRR